MAVWRQTTGLENITQWAGEQGTTADGNWEEVWAHRRSKAPLLGRARGGGTKSHWNLFPYAHADSQRAGHLQSSLLVLRGPLVLAKGDWELLMWTKGNRGLSVMW